MIEKVKKTIRENNLFGKDTHVILGLSGGPDSMCLFDVLFKLSEDMNLTIYPVHINHLFRPGAAEEDQTFVEKICRDRGLKCKSFVYDCNRISEVYGLTSEEAGRKARYQAFGVVASRVASKLKRSDVSQNSNLVIAVAQNAQDQAETILFRILRGTSVDGLGGIAYKRIEKLSNLVGQLPEEEWKKARNFPLCETDFPDGGDRAPAKSEFAESEFAEIAIVRPLLDISREEIEEYCKRNNLNPRRDHTNEEALYTRNKIRLELLPYLEENYNQNILETVNRLGRAAATDSQYIWQQAEKAFSEAMVAHSESADSEVFIRVEKVKALHKAVRYRVYNRALKEIGMVENVTTSYLKQIDSILLSDSPSGYTELTDGYRASRKYEELVFSRGVKEGVKVRYSLKAVSVEDYKKTMNVNPKGRVFGAFGGEELPSIDLLQVRKREDGDYIVIRGAGKNAPGPQEPGQETLIRKKLQDFLVDEKVPKEERDRIMVLARGSEVLWVLPSASFKGKTLREKGRFSAKYKVNFEKDNIVIVLEII